VTKPSEYELEAWQNVQRFMGRPLSRAVRSAGDQVAVGAAELGNRAAAYLGSRPRAQAAVSKAQSAVANSAQAASSTARRTVGAIPGGLTEWSGAAFESTRTAVGRVSRVGLSPKRVVALHKKRGHDVESLSDLRNLDLERIDEVGMRGATWYYPAAAALSGMGAGLVISGGEFVTATSAGAAAAPSGAAIVGAFAGDTAVVLGLASRSVGHVSLLYGYDPEEPAEKLFIMSVVNAGTAMSATAKTAALADLSRLTQALVRGKTWEVLNKSVISKVSAQFAKAFGYRLTKQGLGKVVPAVGIVIGGTFNWTTLEAIVDAANVAYRRRFLLEKYPHIGDDDAPEPILNGDLDGGDDSDQTISVLDELAGAGGPDLR
jgi:hypothetical protein